MARDPIQELTDEMRDLFDAAPLTPKRLRQVAPRVTGRLADDLADPRAGEAGLALDRLEEWLAAHLEVRYVGALAAALGLNPAIGWFPLVEDRLSAFAGTLPLNGRTGDPVSSRTIRRYAERGAAILVDSIRRSEHADLSRPWLIMTVGGDPDRLTFRLDIDTTEEAEDLHVVIESTLGPRLAVPSRRSGPEEGAIEFGGPLLFGEASFEVTWAEVGPRPYVEVVMETSPAMNSRVSVHESRVDFVLWLGHQGEADSMALA